jgi:O-antigen/teichoic acid export membrane protein
VVAIALFEQIGNDTFQLLTNLERPVLATLTAFVRQAAWILVYAPLAAFYDARFRSLEVLLIFWLAGAVLSFVIFAGISRKWPWRTSFGRSFRPLWLLSRVRSSLVIYASDISFIASQYIDRYVVTLFLGLKVAGLYMLYWTAANAMYTFVSMTVLQQQRPLLIRTNLEGNLSFRRLCAPMALRTAMATVFFGLMVGVAFEIVLPLLKQPLATENLTAFWLIVSGLAARCMADWGAIALFAARRDQIMTITNLAAVTGLAVCQSVLLPFAGLAGAGIALLVTFAAVTYWRMQLVFSGPVYRQARMEA